jgi:hypothetical protein
MSIHVTRLFFFYIYIYVIIILLYFLLLPVYDRNNRLIVCIGIHSSDEVVINFVTRKNSADSLLIFITKGVSIKEAILETILYN